ncbi:NAD(P)H-binding protein [Brachybacterium sp. p3-SID1565]|uniref:NAD(P)-dependent oxidoreductase n=1 Tax=Brachybacterium sp. p3-SID1565 TaxID=2916046 RepID=UPI0021A4A9FF|nr:NAD(P)H-binding protein [Brachybacterium sp. p3-SID1565]MCT1384775.1 NAD(P)H-binding protein [Brachybacterium sp. p3-SID1565]
MAQQTLAVIGADDPLGEAVVREALVRGLRVLATAPLPRRVPRLSPELEVLRAESGSQEDLEPAVRGADGVVLALTPQLVHDATMLATDAAIAAVRAMRAVGAQRLVGVSSTQLSDSSRLWGPLRRRLHHGGLQDLRRLERLLAGSGLDWTVLRAGRTTDLLGTREQVVGSSLEHGDRTLPREDLARALVDQALAEGREPRILTVTA